MEFPSLDRERELFTACLQLPAADRLAYLDIACGDDSDMRARVGRILAAHARETSAFASLAALSSAECPAVGGRYRVTRMIDEGGMGTVYEAEQHEPVQRLVALKLIRPSWFAGPSQENLSARFAAELQTLAIMDHPNVAKVFDAGETALGQPFLVMELVSGAPITTYCEQRNLPVCSRIRLFLQLCRAVEHAHQKGIIHRDLKPGNVLVGGTDAEPLVKVIDFGISKAMGDPIAAPLTLTGIPIGTPAYMSPEQAGAGKDVDTRSDIYSLGVILYELAAGVLPAEPDESGYAHFLTRLASGDLNHTLPSRKAPPHLRREIQEDLDWIVLRALEADRNRRYASASALAEDLERLLAEQPVSARSPTLAYRLGKFIRRNRFQTAAAAVAVIALVGGSIAAGIGYVRALRAETFAREEAAAAGAVSRFLVNAFKMNDPGQNRGRTVTARELLENASAQVDSGFSTQPAIRQRLLTVISQAYSSLGLHREALGLAQKATASLPRPGRETLEDAAALLALGSASGVLNQFEKARDAAARAVAIRKRHLGPRHLDVAAGLFQQAHILATCDEFDAALALMNEVLSLRREAMGQRHIETGRALYEFGYIHGRRRRPGDRRRSGEYYRQALAIYETALGTDHPDYARTLDQIGLTEENGKAALPWLERSLAIRKRVMGADHPVVADSLYNIGRAHSQMGKFAAAKPFLLDSLKMREASIGPESMQVGLVLHSLGIVESGLRCNRDALPYFRRSLAISSKTLGPNSSVALLNHMNLGKVLARLRRYDEALPHLEEGLRGGFTIDWEDNEYNPVRKDPRFLALVAEQARLKQVRPAEKQWVHPVK